MLYALSFKDLFSTPDNQYSKYVQYDMHMIRYSLNFQLLLLLLNKNVSRE